MKRFLADRPWKLAVAFGIVTLLAVPATVRAQGELIGQRGGLLTPPAATTPPVLPSSLNLPPLAQSSLLNGLNSSGTAVRHGMGWLVSDLTHQGIRGQQLADIIHQLKPYKERGLLTFPQNAANGAQPLLPFAPQERGEGMPNFGRGFGKGNGKGKR